ncbi:cobalamin biosynthesis protein [Albidovulum inexpectatum]|uniref:cobalamin biosynthesis protein n=1 Tax=Albidovulum inexpectatum TaxID=196587 RepID=UPI003182ECB6
MAGIGLRANARADSIADALARAGGDVACLAVLADKAGHPALRAFSARAGMQVRLVPRESLAGIVTLSRSSRIEARFGTGSVAEALALVGAGPGARLVGPRVVSHDGLATAAIAERMDE